MSYAQVRKKLPFSSVVLRTLLVMFLVFATVNPSKYTLTTWVIASDAPLSVRLLVAFTIFAVWIAVLRIAWQGLRAFGFILVLLVLVILGLLEVQFGIIDQLSGVGLNLAILFTVVGLISLGIVGSYFVRGISGQSPVVKTPP